jgi:hypothetical protein
MLTDSGKDPELGRAIMGNMNEWTADRADWRGYP